MDLECKFSENKGVVPLYASTVCKVLRKSVSPYSKISSFKGSHLKDKSNNDVKLLVMSRVPLLTFPRNITKFYQNLKHLIINDCSLNKISGRDLKGLENLTSLTFVRTALVSLPDDLLVHTPNLKALKFIANKIEFLSSKMFEPLKKSHLSEVDFSGNVTINAYFDLFGNGEAMRAKPNLIIGPAHRVKFLDDLMLIIDTNCKDPSRDEETRFKNLCYFELLANDNKWFDFVIVLGSRVFKVHRSVLAYNSPVFKAMFDNDFIESSRRELVLDSSENWSEEAFEEFICCLYSQEAPQPRNAVEIYRLARKYKVLPVEIECEEVIIDNIDEDNAIFMVKFASFYQCDEITFAAYHAIINSLSDDVIRYIASEP